MTIADQTTESAKRRGRTFWIDEALLRRACIREHGEAIADVIFDSILKTHQKNLDKYHAMERERDNAVAERIQIEAGLPSLEPLRDAMNSTYEKWLAAFEAL